MKKLSSLVLNFLNHGIFSTFALLDIEMGEASFHFTTLPTDATIGGIAYTADNSLVSFDTPKSTTAVDKATFKLTFADTAFAFRDVASVAAAGGSIRIRVGFYNINDNDIISTNLLTFEPGQPILDAADFVIMHEGAIDKPAYTFSESSGVVFELTCASPMAALDLVNSFYTTRFSLQQRVKGTTDTCFDKVSLGGTAAQIKWGKTS